MTLTCQAVDNFIHFLGDSMVHTVELIWVKPRCHRQPPSHMPLEAFCQMLRLYSYAWPHSDKICEFAGPKRGFLAP